MAVLKWQLRDSSLFVSTLPVNTSTLGVADHHLRCCLGVNARVDTCGEHVQAFVSSLVAEHSFLARVYEATWDPSDVEMRKLTRRARGSIA